MSSPALSVLMTSNINKHGHHQMTTDVKWDVKEHLESNYPNMWELLRLMVLAQNAGKLTETLTYLKKNLLRDDFFKIYTGSDAQYEYTCEIEDLGIKKDEVVLIADIHASKGKRGFVYQNAKVEDSTVYFLSSGICHAIQKGNDGDKVFEMEYTGHSSGGVMRIFSEYLNDLKKRDPVQTILSEIAQLEDAEFRRKQDRLKNAPPCPANFDEAIKHIYDYAESREEFFSLTLGADSVDLSDRNRTRLGRAMLGLPDNKKDVSTVGKRRESITVYRASPKNTRIEAGDWVTLSRGYAMGHARAYNENVKNKDEILTVSQKTVSADSVIWDGSSLDEYFYVPSDIWGDLKNEDDLWNKINTDNKPDFCNSTSDSINKLQSRLRILTLSHSDTEMSP